jgi:hypothetical protein
MPGHLDPSRRTEILHFIDNAKVTVLPMCSAMDPQPPAPHLDLKVKRRSCPVTFWIYLALCREACPSV